MKKLCFLFAFIFCSVFCFAQSQASEEFIEDEDFDSLFEEAEDTVVQNVPEKTSPSAVAASAQTTTITLPFSFSGNLNFKTGFGGTYTKEPDVDWDRDEYGYFDFSNKFYISSKPNGIYSFKSSFNTELSDLTGSSGYIHIYEMYFDYLLLDRIYLTGGKKYIGWSYMRLFKDDENVNKLDQISFYRRTNLLTDSRNGVDVMVRIPLFTGTITGIALYNGTNTQPKMDDLSFAGSIEMTVLKTSINLFARKTPKEHSLVTNGNLTSFVEGVELKRTFFGIDVYGQFLAAAKGFTDSYKFWTDFNTDHYQSMVATGGFYYIWEKIIPNIGINVEYQYSHNNIDAVSSKAAKDNQALAFDFGLKKIGPKKNIKIGCEGRFCLSDWQGYIKPGVSVSGLFPNANWDTGVKYEFNTPKGQNLTYDKITVGTYLTFNLGY